MLNTEKRNPDTYGIDKMSTEEMLRIINNENANVTLAVEKALPETYWVISSRFSPV